MTEATTTVNLTWNRVKNYWPSPDMNGKLFLVSVEDKNGWRRVCAAIYRADGIGKRFEELFPFVKEKLTAKDVEIVAWAPWPMPV